MIPSGTGGAKWMLGWLLAVPATYLVVTYVSGDLFDPKITLGEVITIGLVLVSATVTLLGIARYPSYRRRPFRLRFSLDPHEYGHDETTHGRDRRTAKSMKVPIGETLLLLVVRPRRETHFEEAHLRLLKKKWSFSLRTWPILTREQSFPKRGHVGITRMAAMGLATVSTGRSFSAWQDHVNGMDGAFSKPYSRAPEDTLYLEVRVCATESWEGYLVFQSTRADGHRGYAYAKLTVIGKAG